MNILAVIPARFQSTRFPGKPLVDIQGKTMIQRVYEQTKKANVLKVVVATDDERIYKHVINFGGEAMMTNVNHKSGTDRCFEVLLNLEAKGEEYDIVVNVQGDEPFINPDQINKVCSVFKQDELAEIATLVKQINNEDELFNPNTVKVVLTDKEEGQDARDAIYFSRNPIPFLRGIEQDNWLANHTFYKHIGIYAFNVEQIYEISELEQSPLEIAESLEQLRWLANHFTIQAVETNEESIGIDTPEDIEKLK